MNEPRAPTEAEYAGMDLASKRAMYEHNTFGERHCGWRAPA